MRPLNSFILLTTLFLASPGWSAELGTHYDSYRDMHEQTDYGSLFFNSGAIRPSDDQSLKRFEEINGNGQINLPHQEGYCFVFNHYNGSDGPMHRYQGKISKWFDNGTPKTTQTIRRTFTSATHSWSSALPDLCVNGLQDVTKVLIVFSSDAGLSFSRNISFNIQ